MFIITSLISYFFNEHNFDLGTKGEH